MILSTHSTETDTKPFCAVQSLVSSYPWGWVATRRGCVGSSAGAGSTLTLDAG